MFKATENHDSVLYEFGSDMKLVDRVVAESKRFLHGLGVGESREMKIVLRELLINSVEHGNQNDSAKIVTCEIKQLGESRFSVTVQDQGGGFDHSSLEWTLPDDPNQNRRRGYGLINSVADEIEFDEGGSKVTVYVGIVRETGFETETNDGWMRITPSGDLTANVADKFRLLLIQFMDEGHFKFQIDLSNVDDIDSISLSVLISLSKMLDIQSADGKVEILNTNFDLLNMFHITRIDELFEVHPA